MWERHPYLDPRFIPHGPVQAQAVRNARDAAQILGDEYVNDRLLDAARRDPREYAQAKVARQLAAEASARREQELGRQMAAARAAEARRARAAFRRAQAGELLLLQED
jgi:hypothetical protein